MERIKDAAMLRRWTLVCRDLRGTAVIGRASNCTLQRRVSTELFPAHPANEVLSAGAATNLSYTCEYWTPIKLKS